MIVSYYNKKDKCHYILDYSKGLKYVLSMEDYQLLCNFSLEKSIFRKLTKNYFAKEDGEIKENKIGFTLFDSPYIELDNLFLNDYDIDIVVMGFPYDLGASQYRNSKFGPDILRYTSTSILDSNILNRIGIKIGDLGNIKGEFFKINGLEFNYLMKVIEFLVSIDKFPIVIGGDHSISFATITGVCDAMEEVGIIHFDAHQDYLGLNVDKMDWKEKLNHSNFIDFILARKEITSIVQIGVRNIFLSLSHPKIKTYGVEESIEKIDEILNSLNKNISYFITFDVDCLSTAIMKSTGTPVSGGFEFREISKILRKVISTVKVVGMDLVELTNAEPLDSVTVNQLLIDILTERCVK